jgi:hypothetical protein
MPPGFDVEDTQVLFFRRSMTELAYILKQVSEDIYHRPSKIDLKEKCKAALKLDEALLHWKSQLSPIFDLDSTPLTERESTTKRKVVLKLRE